MRKGYKKVKIVGTKEIYAYVEYQTTYMFMHKGRWITPGKDIITGELIVCDDSIYNYKDLIRKFCNHALLPGRLFLYGSLSEYLTNEKMASVLNKMTEEEIKEYIENIKKAKNIYKYTRQKAKKLNKGEAIEYRHQNQECRKAKRKVKIIAKNI